MHGVSFKCGQLALLLVQAALERRPDVLEVGVSETGQGQEFVGQLLARAEGGQDALDVGDGGEHLTRLDLGDLALRDSTAAGEPFAGKASGFAGISERRG